MATNTTTTTTFIEATYNTPIDIRAIDFVVDVDLADQLAVFRKDIETLVGQALTTREYRELGVVPSSWISSSAKESILSISVPPGSTYTLENGTVVSVPAMTTSEALLIFRKRVYSEPLVEWISGTRLAAEQFNTNTAQLLNAIQELSDSLLLFPRLDDPKYIDKDYVDGEIADNVTTKLGTANGIATLDSSGKIPATQFNLGLGEFGGTFFSEATAPTWTLSTNEFDFGSLWYNLSNGRLYVWFPKTPATPSDGVGFWVDTSAPVI